MSLLKEPTMNPNELQPQQQALHIMTGHWVAQIAATVTRFGVPDQLAKGAKSSDELADACGASRDGMFRLLRAATDIGVLTQPEPKKFALTPVGEFFRSNTPGSIRELLVAELAPGHWLPWGHLYDAVKTGKSTAQATLGVPMFEYYAKNAEEGACFARGMTDISGMAVNAVLGARDFSSFNVLVDVGGSQGALLGSILKSVPKSRGVLFDLPEVIAAGAAAVARHELGDRLKTVAGDFFKEVPAGGDAYFLKHILHDWDDAKSVAILKTIHRAAKPGAKLFVVEMLLSDQVGSPVNLMDLNMLVCVDGRERSAADFEALFSQAGFRLDKLTRTPSPFVVVEATRV
jgi:hypothetical protein